LLAISVGASLSVLLFWLSPWRADDDPIRRLVEASDPSYRDIQPRLTGGFRWAPLRQVGILRGEVQKGFLPSSLVTAASDLVRRSQVEGSQRSQHAAALAYLLTGRVQAAASSLEGIAPPGGGAAILSDLAAVRYVVAERSDDALELAQALAVADGALRADAKLPEARFNRALILERFGLRDQAREEWEQYLRLDGGSDWGNDARQHIRQLQPIPSFKGELNSNYERLTRDHPAAREFAVRHREDARRWGETEILGRWATSETAGDHASAAKHLSVAREFGTALASDRGDCMLQALVDAIDRANEAERAELAKAHLAFREGQRTYGSNEPSKAEAILLTAAAEFERGKSPGSLLARYFAANTAYSQGRIEEADRKLRQLLAVSPPRFSAHRAQVLWQIGLGHFAAARWSPCIEALNESVATFERLDERAGASNVRQILASAYERIGSPREAWKHRMITLRELGQRPSARLEGLLRQFGRTQATSRDWASSASFFKLAADIGRRIDEPLIQIETLTNRAIVNIRMNDRAAAAADIAEARSILGRVREPAYRRLLETNVKEVDALLATSPAEAIRSLSEVIAFHQTEGRRMFLPELFFERGRAYLGLNDPQRAAADFESGVAELESRRETLAAGEDRWGIFYDADELFSAAIDQALASNDAEAAFRYAERARARGLLDSLGATWPKVTTADIPANAIVVEYAVQPKRLLIFVLDARGIRVAGLPVERETLIKEVEDLQIAASEDKDREIHRAGRALYRRLVEPIENDLSGKSIVFVPDPKLGSIPFAALVDGAGRYVIENHALSVAPSAAVFARLAKKPASESQNLLLITGAEDLGPLRAVEREASAVSVLYPHFKRLRRETATRESFLREAPMANIIHFAGHGVSSNERRSRGYLLLAGSELDQKEIAALRLPKTQLVVLAACSTAAGEVRSTEGTISIARGFLAAGVPSVIATLWPVDDERSADFFPVVHRYIMKGLPPAEALRAAQIDAIHDPNGSPALWASVQLIGR
jgi:CHAT domain-containing protein